MNARSIKGFKFTNLLWMLAICFVAAPMAKADDAVTMQQLRQQLDALTREVQVLRNDQNKNWLDEKRTEEVKALVKEVLNDADTRASLLENGVTAGWNNGFFMASEDGSFKLRVMGMIEFRYGVQLRSESGGDNGQHGFEIPAVRYGFKGHMIDPSWQFFIWNGHGTTGSYTALNAMITKVFNPTWSVTVGTQKVPFWREYLISETAIAFPDRTPLANIFSEGYTEGLWINYKKDWLKAVLCLSDGGSRYVSANAISDAEGMAVSLRAEAVVVGDWKQAKDSEAWLGNDPFVMLGGAVHFEQGEYGDSTDEAQQLSWTVDATLKYKGFSIMGAFVAKHISETTVDTDQYGALVQGGLFVAQDLQLIARYGWGDLDSASEEDLQIASIGFNKFFRGHALKFTGELGYSFNPITSGWSVAGWQTDGAGQDGQIMARAELHLLF